MSNLSLVRFDQNGLELFVDENGGLVYASISATARMCEKGESTIRAFLTSQKIETKTAEVVTGTGLKTSQLLSSDQVFRAALKYNLKLAEKMGACGANVYMCGVAGYQVSVTTNESLSRLEKQFLPIPTAKSLKEFYGLHKLMYGKAYADRWLAAKIKEYYPEQVGLPPAPEELSSLPIKALLTPTEIAVELGVLFSTGSGNGAKINQLLAQLGYQEKIGKQWSPTSKADGLCDRKPVDTNSRTQKDQLSWTADILSVLAEHCVEAIA